LKVGVADGLCTGAREGEREGALDGLDEGGVLGVDVTATSGDGEGAPVVGDCEGAYVAPLNVGVVEGWMTGAAVGIAEGSCVG